MVPPDEVVEGPSIREALEAAEGAQTATEQVKVDTAAEVAKTKSSESGAPAAEGTSPLKGGTERTEPAAGERQRGPDGKFLPEKKTPLGPVLAKPGAAGAGAVVPPLTTPASGISPTKAPAGWNVQEREIFKGLPPAAQEVIVRRENEIGRIGREAAQYRAQAEAFQQVIAPFDSMIRAEGANPLAAVDSLLRTAAALRTAPASHKAQIIAHIVTSYLGTGEEQMKMLAAAIDGQPIQNGQAQIDPNQLAQRIEQQVLSRFQQQQEENWGQQATEEVQSFSTDKEFFDDVRETMGDLMEVAAKRGVAMSMDQAYTKACQLDEGIAEVLGQRAAAERANASTASTQQIRAAASSVKSEPAGVTASPNPDSVRGAIELAYERAMGR